MDNFTRQIQQDLAFWKMKMMEKPSFFNAITTRIQAKVNSYIPVKVHKTITAIIKPLVQSVLFGSKYTTSAMPAATMSLQQREALIKEKIESYKKTGAAEGGITGAGGFMMSLADFPILIAIKIKMLFEIASLYGFNIKDYRERLYILHIFQLAFSSQKGRKKIFLKMRDWNKHSTALPQQEEKFDWQTFQQEYRDYIDLAKLAQLLPVVGAAVGAVANYKLIDKLGKTAIMSYRMRLEQEFGARSSALGEGLTPNSNLMTPN